MNRRDGRPNGLRPALMALCLLAALSGASGAQAVDAPPPVLELSQAALGNRLTDAAFVDTEGRQRRLSEFLGRPLLVSLIFSSCAHSCSVTTRHIDRVVRIARNALGQDSFTVLTIGFDHPVDSPQAMRAYAARHGVNDPDWHFLSSEDPVALATLMRELGFYYEPSARGFDHTVQVSVLDRQGVLYRQVYGDTFSAPQLVEPLKQLVLGRPEPDEGLVDRLADRVRLFCTVYDARADRYHFDYSLFVGMLIGAAFLGAVFVWLLFEVRHRRLSGLQ